MQLFLGVWQGEKEGCYFRCGDSTATRLLWAVKKIAQAQQQAERLVALLRSHGIDPDQIAADL